MDPAQKAAVVVAASSALVVAAGEGSCAFASLSVGAVGAGEIDGIRESSEKRRLAAL